MRAACLLVGMVLAAACTRPRALAPPPGPVPYHVARPDPTPPPDLRLPDTVVPVGYRAELSLDAKLSGSIEIVVDLAAPTDTIWMNGVRLAIESADARAADGAVTRLDARVLAPARFVALLSRDVLPAGRYTLRLHYAAAVFDAGDVDAQLTDWYAQDPHATGVFRQHVESRAYTFTMFETFGAREAFPCFDEPRFKVPWQLTLDVTGKDIALSNTPVASDTRLPDGRHRFVFAPTPPLPSYLIAFAAGPFDLVEVPGAGVPLRVAVRKGHATDAAWAVASSRRVLDLVLAWTAQPMPYPKIDLLAVPITGIGWIAMENPGLITIRESTLRGDGTGGETREAMIATLAHELVHYWFGDSVTPAWWDDIWLNESFAYWVTPQITGEFRRQWGAELVMPPLPPPPPRSGYWHMTPVGIGARPVARETTTFADMLRYMGGQNGAPVIEMIEGLVGPDRFRDILRAYLAAHANGIATTAELIPLFDAAAGMPLADAVDVYLDDARPPAVAVTASCTGGPPTIAVTRANAALQKIPMCIAYDQAGARVDACFLFETARHEVPLKACPAWILPNARSGIYDAPLDHFDLALAWPKLAITERIRLATMTSQGPRLEVALRLLDEHDDAALAASFPIILENLRYLPDAVRPAFAARLRAKVSLPRDSALAAAVAADPSLVIPQLDRIPVDLLSLRAIAESPSILDALEQRPRVLARLTPVVQLMLLATRCEPSLRAQALRIAGTTPDIDVPLVTSDLDRCTRARALVEPVFRAWAK